MAFNVVLMGLLNPTTFAVVVGFGLGGNELAN